MKKLIFFLSFYILSFSLSSQHINDLEDLNLDFSWSSDWSYRYDYQIISPHDSSLLGKLTKVSENFWQKEIYDLQGNWLDTYRYVKEDNGHVFIAMGESIIDDRYYQNTNLQKRVIAKNGKAIEAWSISYNEESQIQRYSIEDSLSVVEKVFFYDTLNRLERIKVFKDGEFVEQEQYTYTKSGALEKQLTLTSSLDSLFKVEYVFDGERIMSSRSLRYQDEDWILKASESYQYSSSQTLLSINFLTYSTQGNCIFSSTESYNSLGLVESREQIDLISGDWQLIKSFYQSSEQGIIVLGAE